MSRVLFHKCIRCRGAQYIEIGDDGLILSCTNCQQYRIADWHNGKLSNKLLVCTHNIDDVYGLYPCYTEARVSSFKPVVT